MVLPKVSLQFAKATEFPCLGGARVRCERMPLCVGEASESMSSTIVRVQKIQV